jgi:hypothetical protein
MLFRSFGQMKTSHDHAGGDDPPPDPRDEALNEIARLGQEIGD